MKPRQDARATLRLPYETMANHGPINLEVFVEPMFQENGLLVWPRPAGGGRPAAWIIDPGFPPQPGEILARLEELRLDLAAIVLTHCHVDHIAGIEHVRARFASTPIVAPAAEAEMLGDAWLNFSAAMGSPITSPEADRLISPGDTLRLGDVEWRVLDVSGHSPGGLAFYCESAGIAIVGDSLFNGSIGRYDFPGSSGARLMSNIHKHLLTLPPETVIYSGHGPRSTIGHEQRTNPYVQAGFVP